MTSIDPFREKYLTLNAFHGLFLLHSPPTRVNLCLDHFFIKADILSKTLIHFENWL